MTDDRDTRVTYRSGHLQKQIDQLRQNERAVWIAVFVLFVAVGLIAWGLATMVLSRQTLH